LGLSFTGCGGSEEVTEGEEGQTLGEGQTQEQPADAGDQALTSFIGAKEPAAAESEKPAQTAAATGQLGQYEKQIEDLRTENTSLKQKIVKLEQDNRTLNTMMAESESKIQAERWRGDSLQQALASQPMAAAAPVTPGEEPAYVPETPMSITSYEEALQAFNGKRYDDAIAALEGMLSQGVSKDLEDNCTYWIGESRFGKKQYKDAIAAFVQVMSYAVSEKKGDAQYMIAQSYERLGNKAKAKEGYEKVVKDYPLNKVVKKAKERWARL
ncbi:MAG: tetratricopeptide repeat protein, partial [Bacteroidota bacterium]